MSAYIDTGRFVNMQNAAPLYCTIKKIQRYEDSVFWRVYGRLSRTITPFFSPGQSLSKWYCVCVHMCIFVFIHAHVRFVKTLQMVQAQSLCVCVHMCVCTCHTHLHFVKTV